MKYVEEAVNNANDWLLKSRKYLSKEDKNLAKKMNKLFKKNEDKGTLISIMDRAFRSKNTYGVAQNVAHILKKEGIPSFFDPLEKFGILLFLKTWRVLHFILIPFLKYYIIRMSSKYVLFGGNDVLIKRIKENKKRNLNTNVNRVGELLLGEEDAKNRIARYIKDLENPDIACISIKISTIYSQILSISFEDTVEKLIKAITPIYRVAKKHNKLVNFDMEEYRDLSITVAVFIGALSLPEFNDLNAGIALQAYLPDSFLRLVEIINFAKERVKNGGSPVRVRVVKGANMEMEVFESLERGWSLAPFNSKLLTDANYKKMLEFALIEENIKAVNIGIASHNLFDISYVYLIAKRNRVLDYCTFEMLSGMSPHVAYFLANEVGLNILLYLPFSSKEDFISSIGYLVRRLDENTGKDNYLRYIHELSTSEATNIEIWQTLKQKFVASLEIKMEDSVPNRKQDRNLDQTFSDSDKFTNASDTDFALPQNVLWAQNIKEKYQNKTGFEVSCVIDGEDLFFLTSGTKILNSQNRSIEIGKYYNAKPLEAQKAIECAKEDASWSQKTHSERKSILLKAIENISSRRGDMIGIMALETGKLFTESDVEVSEAVDLSYFYLLSYESLLKKIEGKVLSSPKGTTLVLTPWNFPFAIPCGGIFAALVSGNNVIFKPSSFSTLIGFELAKCFWDAGISKKTLQFICSEASETAKTLTKSTDIDLIIFTGGTSTALNIISSNPKVKISAETGGKNFTIATKNSDRDQVIKNVLQSAFSNSGQKCSATSVLALEEELYNDQKFLSNLKDAVMSLKVDYAFKFSSKVGTLIRRPSPSLQYGMTTLEEGEEWLVKPEMVNGDDTLWKPGVRIGVKPNSRAHMEEFFGPTLAIMKIKNLKDGIELANKTGYGLTSGLESLNEMEQNYWMENINAGNLYINKATTGAVVERQPFGGFGKSAFGRGIKAGGGNYIIQFLNFKTLKLDKVLHTEDVLNFSLQFTNSRDILENQVFVGYAKAYFEYFAQKIDAQKIEGQQNITRFLPVSKMAIRVLKNSSKEDIINLIFAANLTLKSGVISFENQETLDLFKNNDLVKTLTAKFDVKVEDEKMFIQNVSKFERIRFSKNEISDEIFAEASKSGTYISEELITGFGTLDLLHFLKEQSISYNYHRYGYIDYSKRLL